MADKERMVRVKEPDDPMRCKANGPHGQCTFTSVEGAQNCPMHNGGGDLRLAKAGIRNFRLTRWQARVDEFADSGAVKSLREEIGILRMVLEETVNQCRDATDLLMYSNKISDTVSRIERLVVSCNRLEERTGSLLDKSAAINLAGMIVEIIGREIEDDVLLESISEQILTMIAQTNSPIREKLGA